MQNQFQINDNIFLIIVNLKQCNMHTVENL